MKILSYQVIVLVDRFRLTEITQTYLTSKPSRIKLHFCIIINADNPEDITNVIKLEKLN